MSHALPTRPPQLPRRRGRCLVWTVLVAVAALVATGAAGPPAALALAGRAAAADSSTKIDARLRARLAEGGETTFLVRVKGTADLTGVPRSGSRAKRAAAVLRIEQAFAERAQKGVRTLLRSRDARFTPYWVSNVVQVAGDAALAAELAARPDVVRIAENVRRKLPKPTPSRRRAQVDSVEWNIAQIRADRVWSDFSDRGEGVVVANLDTGVEHTHPALVNSYRGRRPDGSFDHAYNWFDPTGVCGDPANGPCDDYGHGTHTMGTMVGDDGGQNQLGVAPGARWIAVKGCSNGWCEDSWLLAGGQWVVAPTDLSGANPRPDLAPDVVNNSWGDGSGNFWFADVVASWRAAGIFPAFSVGNAGAGGCGTAGSPGDYGGSYSAGAYDSSGNIAEWSSRGPSTEGLTKPDLSAPGVDVRSSVPGGGYDTNSGTSMASPHVAGTVALIWAGSPAVRGDLDATARLLDAAAVDVEDTSCGGTAADNNVYGEGRLDAYSAVSAAPRGPTGELAGTVTSGGDPVADAQVAVSGPWDSTARTETDGRYRFGHLPVGDYTITVSKFGYRGAHRTATVTDGGTTTADVELVAVPAHLLSGTVTETGGDPVAGAVLTVVDTPLPPVTTGADGRYRFDAVPEGDYTVTADAGRWLAPVTRQVQISGDTRLDLTLPAKSDGYGYVAAKGRPDWVQTDTVLPLTGDDAQLQVDTPFPVPLYDAVAGTVKVSTNGYLTLGDDAYSYTNTAIPSAAQPNSAVYALWDDLYVDSQSSVRTGVTASAPHRRFAVEWRDVGILADPARRVDVQIVFDELGRITLQYRGIDPASPLERGASATVGIEDAAGTVGLQYSLNAPALSDDVAASFTVPGSGFARGGVTDANDHLAVAGATVSTTVGGATRSVRTGADGGYALRLPAGSYRLAFAKTGYRTVRRTVTVGADAFSTVDVVLKAAVLTVRPQALEVVAKAGQTRRRTLTLRNTGTATGTWELKEATGGTLTATAAAAAVAKPRSVADPLSRDARKVIRPAAATGRTVPQTAGDVLRSWQPSQLGWAWGAGFDGGVWISDAAGRVDARYTVDGAYERQLPAGFGEWPADLARVPARGLMCQLAVGGDNGIHCWDPADGHEVAAITGPWSGISQRGLAYRPDDDSFYLGGWNEGVIYHVQGLGGASPGAVISSCASPRPSIAGLAWSPRGVLWETENAETEQITGLNPDTCEAVRAVPDPSPLAYSGAGVELDDVGNLWLVGQDNSTGHNTAYLVDSGLPSFSDVGWLKAKPASGSLAPGKSVKVTVTVDTTGLEPGVHGATLFVSSSSPRSPLLGVPVKLVVPRYRTAVDAGAKKAGTDRLGDRWAKDRRWASGKYGYLGSTTRVTSKKPIARTAEDWLYRSARQGAYEYRFDRLPAGTYLVELDFAELVKSRENQRVFDVTLERQLVLPGYDIVAETGGRYRARREAFVVEVSDGRLGVRLLARTGRTLLNGVRVTERPDLAPPG